MNFTAFLLKYCIPSLHCHAMFGLFVCLILNFFKLANGLGNIKENLVMYGK